MISRGNRYPQTLLWVARKIMADVMGAIFQDLAIRCMTALSIFDSAHSKVPLCHLRTGCKLISNVATSRIGKICSVSTDGQNASVKPLKMIPGSYYLPKPGTTRGEDAHFICEDEQVIGLADGVGGWAQSGIDAGEFARELMSHAVNAIKEEPKGAINPLRVLQNAFSNTKAMGSSTACIAALKDQHIHALNIGDSGFIVVRKGSVSFRAPMQQHFFNCPFQLGSGPYSDPPTAGEEMEFGLVTGDVIVAGTDGLFDNLFDNEVAEAILQGNRDGVGPQEMASRLAKLAWERAHDSERVTPFSIAAREAGYSFSGGKIDDITVIVANVTDGQA
ncbi:probable protein phosphatase 2C 55 isoform X3 [Magnolia sinica]|uniref:probable protein phosphatase 2C 55 isoform X3 n=1 Tax=Magnolia sinica TaxID=86752 RepID=UPI0026585CA4|nr:probable protein phosphatase 2C 55 isoform X3 [Magnolia sinica]